MSKSQSYPQETYRVYAYAVEGLGSMVEVHKKVAKVKC